jgi:membrane protease YdiL (CAAX protease family)
MNEPLQDMGDASILERFVYSAFIAKDGRLRSILRFFLSIIVIVIGNFVAMLFASAAGRGHIFNLIYRPLALVLVVGGFALLLKIADGAPGNPLPAMGLSFRKPGVKDAIAGCGIGFALVFIAYLVIRFTCGVTTSVTLNSRAVKLLVVELVILAAGAMLEEVMFRGYPFQRLVESFGAVGRWAFGHSGAGQDGPDERPNRFGAIMAAVLWSTAFGAVHLGNPDASVWSFLNTAFVGLLLCFAYLRTRSLWMPWGIHFAWNTTLGVIFGLPVSGLMEFAVVVRSKAVGPKWITGGSYGIEASALGTAVIVIGIVVIILSVKQRKSDLLKPEDVWAAPDGNASERIQM